MRPACCSRVVGTLRACSARPCQCGPGVFRRLCPVDYHLSVMEVVPSRGLAMLLSLILAMSYAPSCRPRISVHEEMARMTARSWWRVLVDGEAGGGAPIAPGCFCVWGSGEIFVGCLTQTRCRLRVTPFLVGGRRGYPQFTLLRVSGETLGSVRWSGSSAVLTVLLLEGLLGTRRIEVLGSWGTS